MNLIGYGEYRSIDGQAQHLFVRFEKSGGGYFDMPVSPEQFRALVTDIGEGEAQPPPSPTRSRAPEPARSPDLPEHSIGLDETPAGMRMVEVASEDDDDELGG